MLAIVNEWTDARVSRLEALYNQVSPPSAAKIANVLNEETGSTFSRNAIIGKAYRLGLLYGTYGWTSARVSLLRTLYNSASLPSAAQIAKTINEETGSTFSRNAVLSKVYKLGLPRRGANYRGNQRSRKHSSAYVKKPKLEPIECVEVVSDPLNISLTDLKRTHCRWIVNDDLSAPLYCGHHTFPQTSWCLPHLRVVKYRPSRPARVEA